MARPQSAPTSASSSGDREPEAQEPSGFVGRISAFRDRVRRRPGGFLVWRITVTVLGIAIIAGGVVLLPLPGPGWLIIFAGLGVLATEYERAARLLAFARRQVGRWTDWVKRQPRWIQALTGLAGLVVLAAVFYVVYLVLYA